VLNRGLCELGELRLDNGKVLRCDTRHEVLCVEEDGYHWKRFTELEPNDHVCMSLPREIECGSIQELRSVPQANKGNVRPFAIGEFNEAFFYWQGYYFGDGWISHRPYEHRWCMAYALGTPKPDGRGDILARA